MKFRTGDQVQCLLDGEYFGVIGEVVATDDLAHVLWKPLARGYLGAKSAFWTPAYHLRMVVPLGGEYEVNWGEPSTNCTGYFKVVGVGSQEFRHGEAIGGREFGYPDER